MNRIELHLQEGQCGAWELRQFTVTDKEANMDKLRHLINGHPERAIEAGTYWKLLEHGSIYMSNTPAEVHDHEDFISRAEGKVLIAGLGLGMVVQALLDRGKCEKITVVEKSEDVIRLVSPFYQQPTVEIVHADIFTYRPQERYDFAWFDIWQDICGDNYPEMKRLHQRYRRWVYSRDSWCRRECYRLYIQ